MSHRRAEHLLLAGASILTASSWGRWLATGSLKVDENPPPTVAGLLIFTTVVIGWGLMVYAWCDLLDHPPENPRRLAYAGVCIMSLMLPLLSNDVFSVLSYGWLAARGRDVYTTAAQLPESVWYTWTGERWRDTVCVYGPASLLATMPAGLAGANAWVATMAVRITWLVPLVAVMELTFRSMRGERFFHTMLWLNPLWLLEGPGQLHTDMLGVLAVVAGIVAMRRDRRWLAWVCWAVATFGKYTFAFAAPWFWLSGAKTARERVMRLPAMGVTFAVVGTMFFAPFWRGPKTITEPLKALAAMNPGGSLVYEAGEIVAVLTGRQSSAPPGLTLRAAIDLDHAVKAPTWHVAEIVVRLVALVILVVIARALMRKPRDPAVLAASAGAIQVAVVTIASHRFLAWYLLPALPFFGMYCPPTWRRWWVWMVATSVITDFDFVVPQAAGALAQVCSTVGTAATLVLFLLWPGRRYLRLDDGALPGGAAAVGTE